MVLPALRQSYNDLMQVAHHADLMLTHTVATAGPLVAQKLGVPWVSGVVSPIALYSRRDPPLLPILPGLATVPVLGPLWTRALMHVVRKRFEPIFQPVAELRAEIGLPPGQHPLFEGQHSPERVLALFSKTMAEPQPDWPPQTRVTGFCIYDGARGKEPAPELEQFLESGAPPIIFTLGASSVHDAGDFYARSIAAVRELGQRAILIGDAATLPSHLPREFIVLPYVPLSRVLPRCAAIVHHGGIGTIALALQAGCPMLIMPHSHDQPDNAARIARQGVARIISRRQYQTARVSAELEELLGDVDIARCSGLLQKVVSAEDGVRVAADLVEERLEQV
jgi:UDP:flavonoid glycosyltransferase YjiC (YdhE family)